jgi:glycosyltransferase involved in cell wall biosynthesis
MIRSVKSVADRLQPAEEVPRCEPPPYVPGSGTNKVMMAVKLMETHTSDEGWQMQLGLQYAGYTLVGAGFEHDDRNTNGILSQFQPNTVVIQDKREWEGRTAGYSFQKANWMMFRNIHALRSRKDVFKLTVLKDGHHAQRYHKGSADEMGVHGWIIYYHPDIIAKVAPYVRKEHCVRTSHCINKDDVPAMNCADDRSGCLVSGAVSNAYPLRQVLVKFQDRIPELDYLPHPGYGHAHCATPEYLIKLNNYRAAVCTSSIYGYALRKLIEATCCGCSVVTDLPIDDTLPIIEENLTRVSNFNEAATAIRHLCDNYDYDRQREIAERAIDYYDYRAVGERLAADIEELRRNYVQI